MTIKAGNENQDKALIGLTDDFASAEGRRPRVLVALTKSGLSSQFNEVSSSLADVGFDVDISPRFQSAESLARQAVENDVHVLLVLANRSLINDLLDTIQRELNAHKRNDIILFFKTNSPLNADEDIETIENSIVFGSKTSSKALAKHILHTFAEKH